MFVDDDSVFQALMTMDLNQYQNYNLNVPRKSSWPKHKDSSGYTKWVASMR